MRQNQTSLKEQMKCIVSGGRAAAEALATNGKCGVESGRHRQTSEMSSGYDDEQDYEIGSLKKRGNLALITCGKKANVNIEGMSFLCGAVAARTE